MLDPAQFAKNGSEHGHQVALFCKASQHFSEYPELRWMFAIPNGGERNKAVAAGLKAEGVKSAIPDIFLPVARGSWFGLFVELKRPKSEGKAEGKATPEQLECHKELKKLGYGVVVAVGWIEAWNLIVQYLQWK
jgi:hypothetical protein